MMEFKKEYEDILENIDHKSFDSITDGLNKILELLENNESLENIDKEYYQKVIVEADEIKEEASKLLKKEGQEIVKMANLFGISLSDIGLSLSDLQFDS